MLLNFCGFVRSVKFFNGWRLQYRQASGESSWRLVYYQVSGEQGIACCSCRSDIYPGEYGLACACFFTIHCRIIYISLVKFSRLYSNAKLFLTAKFSQSMVFSPWNERTSLIRAIILVPRVSVLEMLTRAMSMARRMNRVLLLPSFCVSQLCFGTRRPAPTYRCGSPE